MNYYYNVYVSTESCINKFMLDEFIECQYTCLVMSMIETVPIKEGDLYSLNGLDNALIREMAFSHLTNSNKVINL